MKLAKRAYVVTLMMLMLVFAVSAQPRSDKDRRNTVPTVGTGGPVGGPTGLFTVYDGQTLRKGEYTVSMAWSNYDRDPGNVDIMSIPLSFQIGVTDHLEFFFGTEAYRGVHTNSPRNLSGFYLPNSQMFINGGFRSPPAIILSPRGPGTSQFPNAAVFRPTGLQPFAQYPFVGGSSGTFGLQVPFFSGPQFGFAAGTSATMGPPSAGGSASAFPGIGSPFGGILPGVVLSTVSLINTAGAAVGEGPVIYTVAPSYLPDAPFLNRTWGQSAFNSFDAGFKWRMNNVNSAVGFGLIGFYRWYADKAGTSSGFNQLQRGAGPGGSRGDVGLILFADARLAEWANLSANFGYVRNSSVKGDFPSGNFTLLDRGDEIQSSIGLDLPVNKHFQYILEIRSLKYVGGRTPNAFENDPIDGIGGIRIFPRRWWGLGLAYRYHMNQQDPNSFESDTVHTTNVIVACRPGTVCTPVTIRNSFQGVPQGFVASTDPHGFIAQLWFGRRDKRATDVVNQPAVVDSVNLGASVITLPCRPGTKSRSGACTDNRTVGVETKAHDPENDVLTYNYTVSGGRVVGSGANVQWDLSTAQTGTYTITAAVDDGCGVCGKTETKTIRVQECSDCVQVCSCPTLSISGPSGLTNAGDAMTFTANVSGGDTTPTYNWTVSAGTIESGQGTASIAVRTTADMVGGNVMATVVLGGLCVECGEKTASETAPVAPKAEVPTPSDVDEFGKAVDDDVKARVQNFYIQLGNNPNAQGYIINYGTAAEIKKRKAQINKAIAFLKFDASRFVFVDADDTGGIRTKFILVPAGAAKPTP